LSVKFLISKLSSLISERCMSLPLFAFLSIIIDSDACSIPRHKTARDAEPSVEGLTLRIASGAQLPMLPKARARMAN
jgi:hypothetical protein